MHGVVKEALDMIHWRYHQIFLLQLYLLENQKCSPRSIHFGHISARSCRCRLAAAAGRQVQRANILCSVVNDSGAGAVDPTSLQSTLLSG